MAKTNEKSKSVAASSPGTQPQAKEKNPWREPTGRFTFREDADGNTRAMIDPIQLAKVIGTDCPDFMNGLVLHISNSLRADPQTWDGDAAFVVGAIEGVAPTDTVEAMLATQMAAIHTATMSFAGKLAKARTLEERCSTEKSLNRLARTFTAQVEALKKHRSGPQQINVKHVHVNEGGKAIVGNVRKG